MNTALVTLTDNSFAQGTMTTLFTLKKHNPWFDHPVIVLYADGDLSEDNQKLITKVHGNTSFRCVDSEDFEIESKISKVAKDKNWGGNRLRKAFYKLALFSISEFDRIVFLDSDTLVLQDISILFKGEEDLILTPDVSIIKEHFNKNPSVWDGNLNTGVMSISKKYLNNKIYRSMISLMKEKKYIGLADQDIINNYFEKHKKRFIHFNYNCLKRVKAQSPNYFKLHKVKILHLVGKKPWSDKIDHPIEKDPAYGPLELLWHVYHNEMLKTISE